MIKQSRKWVVPALLLAIGGTLSAAVPTIDGVRDGSYGPVLASQRANVIDIALSPAVQMSLAINNSNVGGVGGFTSAGPQCGPFDSDPAALTTGVEIAIPLSELGGSGAIKLCAFVNGQGQDFLSNQVSGGLPAPPVAGNLGEPRNVDFSTIAGNQFVTISRTATASGAPTVDGVRDPAYTLLWANSTPAGSGNCTGFGNSTLGRRNQANGSELDAIWAYVDNTNTLNLFIAGNLETNFNKLAMFFDTGAGGQNQLTSAILSGQGSLSRMGGPSGTQPGLKFDAGFNAGYFLSYTIGNVKTAAPYSPTAPSAEHYLDASLILPAAIGTGVFVGGGDKMGGIANPTTPVIISGAGPNGGTIKADSNNSNTGGVSPTSSGTGTSPAWVSDPATVATGVEFKVNLAGIGYVVGSGLPVNVAAFVNGIRQDFVSNQVVGGFGALDGTRGNIGNPKIDWTTITGQQYVTIPGSAFASLGSVNEPIDGTRGAGYNALWVNNNPTGTGQGTEFGDSTTSTVDAATGSEIDGLYYKVGLDPANGNAPTLWLMAAGNLENNFNKLNFFLDTTGVGQNSLRGDNSPIDGGNVNSGMGGPGGMTFDTGFNPGYLITVQHGPVQTVPNDPLSVVPTIFVDGCELLPGGGGYGGRIINACKSGTTAVSGSIQNRAGFVNSLGGFAPGSELDNVTAQFGNFGGTDYLFLHIGGNIAPNFDKLEIFFDTTPIGGGITGQNTLIWDDENRASPPYAGNPNLDFFALNRMGGPFVPDPVNNPTVTQPGLTFNAGFNATHYVYVTHGNLNAVGCNLTSIFGGVARLKGVNSPSDAGAARYWGSKPIGTGAGVPFAGGDSVNELTLCDINTSNTGGVPGGPNAYTANPGSISTSPAGVTNGIELGIPVADLGWTGATPIRLAMFLNRSGHNFVSNQALPAVCGLDLGEPRLVSFSGSGNITLAYNGGSTNYSNSTPVSAAPCTAPLPGAFSLSSPADSSTNVPVLASFQWTASSDAASYTLQVTNPLDLAFASPVVNQTGIAGTSYTLPTPLANNTSYIWRVRAVNGAGTTNSTPSFFTFTTVPGATPPGSFNLTGPTNNQLIAKLPVPTSRNPTFTWTAAADATSYTVQITTPADTGFTTPLINQTGLTGTSWVVSTNLAYATKYRGRVLAVNANGSTVSTPANVLFGIKCQADVDNNGSVAANDLSLLLGAFGGGAGGPADVDGVGGVAGNDLSILLGSFGSCSITLP
ncbi:MAG: hypothetical protein IBJ11_03680 [Phycisphaerales bacterium]|nr:hypothetical protein [Phycisphaerales bacterium]